MRILSIIALVGCSSTSSHLPATDRTDCVGCHAAPALADPPPPPCKVTDHATYPTTCFTCHGLTAWCPADATHTRFDLTTTSHAGWDCGDCHLAVTYDPPAVPDPTAIECTSCHWHDRARVDPFHVGNGDYHYGPATCLRSGCHGDRP
jgi:hypothetical protein